MTTTTPSPAVGYSLLRTGDAHALEACIVLPHVDELRSAAFNQGTKRLDVRVASGTVTLPDIPDDIARLLSQHPSRLLLVTTDALSTVRGSWRADALPDGLLIA